LRIFRAVSVDTGNNMSMENLLKRTVSVTLIILFCAITIIYMPTWFFSLVAITLIGFALYEFYAMVTKKGIFVYRYFGVFMGLILPLIVLLKYGGFIPDLEPLLMVMISLFVFVIQFTRRDNSQALTGIATTLLGLLYISWLFSFIIKIRHMPDGAYLVSFLLLISKSSDISAYLIGSSIGKRNLIPRISPNKTVEGTIGGITMSILLSVLLRGWLPEISIFNVIFLGVLLGVLSQIGDLSESLIKRDCGIKDSGRYIPGLGGVLDLIDSLLFTSPIFYFFLMQLQQI